MPTGNGIASVLALRASNDYGSLERKLQDEKIATFVLSLLSFNTVI
jgi:uncharacterized protein YheU (UPF0270 family)